MADDAVRFALHLQQALMDVDWDARLLAQPLASTVMLETPTGPITIFKGLRVRAVLHTGRPVSIEVRLDPRKARLCPAMYSL